MTTSQTTENFNPNNYYTLIYTNNQYYIHTIDPLKQGNTSILTETKLDKITFEPKFISAARKLYGLVYWQIIDIQQNVHLMIINKDGSTLLRKNVSSADKDNHLIFTDYIECNNMFRMYYTDNKNMLRVQHYRCFPLETYGVICSTDQTTSDTYVDTQIVTNTEHIGHWLYFNCKDKQLGITHKQQLAEFKDHIYYPTQVNFTNNNTKYSYNKCINAFFKNDQIVYQFEHPTQILNVYHPTHIICTITSFATKKEIIYIADINNSVTVNKVNTPNIKFVEHIDIPSLLNFKSKVKTQLITFLIANKIAKNKLPRRLIYMIVCFIQQG